jgi:putative addiction module component (TIGR02574 family)
MKLQATLDEIARLPVDDRIRLVQAILDTIAQDQSAPDPTDDQLRELDRRVAELDADPSNVLTWEQIKAKVRGSR